MTSCHVSKFSLSLIMTALDPLKVIVRSKLVGSFICKWMLNMDLRKLSLDDYYIICRLRLNFAN